MVGYRSEVSSSAKRRLQAKVPLSSKIQLNSTEIQSKTDLISKCYLQSVKNMIMEALQGEGTWRRQTNSVVCFGVVEKRQFAKTFDGRLYIGSCARVYLESILGGIGNARGVNVRFSSGRYNTHRVKRGRGRGLPVLNRNQIVVVCGR